MSDCVGVSAVVPSFLRSFVVPSFLRSFLVFPSFGRSLRSLRRTSSNFVRSFVRFVVVVVVAVVRSFVRSLDGFP